MPPEEKSPKIIFMGTPKFAKIVLEKLVSAKQNIVAVVAQTDKPAGRGQKITVPPVAAYAKKHLLPLLQPHELHDIKWLKEIKKFEPDFICVAAYGQFIPQVMLTYAQIDCLNVHPSLLPEYRGAAPVHQALLDGKKETGVSIMRVTAKMDAGPVFLQKKILISEEDNAITLSDKLASLGGDLLITTIGQILRRDFKPTEQDEKKATFTTKLTRGLSPISWSQNSEEIFNKIRALLPWPVASTMLNNQVLKIYSSRRLVNERSSQPPGQIVHIGKQGMTVATSDFNLLIKEVQLAGKKRMNAFDLINGLKLEAPIGLGV